MAEDKEEIGAPAASRHRVTDERSLQEQSPPFGSVPTGAEDKGQQTVNLPPFVAEFARKAANLNYTASAARGDETDLAIFASKIAVTCERTADWLEAVQPVVADLYAALSLLLADVRDYPAWERPCYAVDVAEAALVKARAAILKAQQGGE